MLNIKAACHSHRGRVRANHEDNFYFGGRCLNPKNQGLKRAVSMSFALSGSLCFGVFDGMGGEEHGEEASYFAAETMRDEVASLEQFILPPSEFFQRFCQKSNLVIFQSAQSRQVARMGTTAVALYLDEDEVYVCNIGDSRAYRLRNGEFLQLTVDHTDQGSECHSRRSTALTQYLGINPEEMLIEPHIGKGELQAGDQYLLCSDGLTDMLSHIEICNILLEPLPVRKTADRLVSTALERGGKDNITVIVCRVC